MPDRNPAETGPYHLPQKFRAHPGVSVLALWSILAGLAMALDSRLPGPTVSVTLSAMPDGFRLWVALALLGGGIMSTAGLLGNWERLDRSWRVERAGWSLVFGAWVTLSVVGLKFTPLGVIAWGDFLAFGLMALVRERAVKRIQQQTVDRMESIE